MWSVLLSERCQRSTERSTFPPPCQEPGGLCLCSATVLSGDLSSLSVLHLDFESWKPQGRWNTVWHRGSGGRGRSSTETVYGTGQTASQTRLCQKQRLGRPEATATATALVEKSVCLRTHMCALVPWESERVCSTQFLVTIFNQNCGGWMRKCLCLVLCPALSAPIISSATFAPQRTENFWLTSVTLKCITINDQWL